MQTPKRVQRKKTKGFKLPANTKCVNRGTKYGNPFKVVKSIYGFIIESVDGMYNSVHYENLIDANKESIRMFDEYCNANFTKEEIQSDLKGKNLACFCSLDIPCHANYLLEIANQ